jgi:hypothetical protein
VVDMPCHRPLVRKLYLPNGGTRFLSRGPGVYRLDYASQRQCGQDARAKPTVLREARRRLLRALWLLPAGRPAWLTYDRSQPGDVGGTGQ